MDEPTIICPKCKTQIKLTESLAAPIITKQWAKREEQIDRVMQATVGMYGDTQGITGTTLQEIERLELPALDRPSLGKDLRAEKLQPRDTL